MVYLMKGDCGKPISMLPHLNFSVCTATVYFSANNVAISLSYVVL